MSAPHLNLTAAVNAAVQSREAIQQAALDAKREDDERAANSVPLTPPPEVA